MSLRDTAIAVSPRRLVAFYRRRRALRRYLRDLSQEVYQRQTRRQRLELDELEGRIVDRAGFYARLVKEVLRGIEVVLEQLDRRIEGITARDANEIRSLRTEVASLRSDVELILRTRDERSSPIAGGTGETGIIGSGQQPRGMGPAADATD